MNVQFLFLFYDFLRCVTEWYQSMVTVLGLNRLNTKIVKEKLKTNFILFFGLIILQNKKRRITLFCRKNMAELGMSAEEESHPRNPINN